MSNIQSHLYDMPDAVIYFACMILIMIALAVVHLACWQIVKRFPDVMPDQQARDWYGWAECVMAAAHLAALWYMWIMLPWMVSICATDPLTGLLAHGPWIIFTGCVFFAKVKHLWKLLGQVKVL